MTTSVQNETAKIYAFPLRGRMATARRDDTKISGDLRSSHGPAVDIGSSYHQAAVQEAERTRKP